MRPWAIAGAALVAASRMGVWTWMRQPAVKDTPLPVTRITVTLPLTQRLDVSGRSVLALSPDGERLVYVENSAGRAQLHLRHLDAFEATPIAGTEGARHPFFSPDGQSVAFFVDGSLKRVSIRGGSPVTVSETPLIARGGAGRRRHDRVRSRRFRADARGGKRRNPGTAGEPGSGHGRLHPAVAAVPAERSRAPREYRPEYRRPGNVRAVAGHRTWHELGQGFQAHTSRRGISCSIRPRAGRRVGLASGSASTIAKDMPSGKMSKCSNPVSNGPVNSTSGVPALNVPPPGSTATDIIADPFRYDRTALGKSHMTRPGISGISPFFIVEDVAAALSFYRDTLDFEFTFQEPAQDPFFAIVCRDGAMIMVKSVLAEATVINYVAFVRRFLAGQFGTGPSPCRVYRPAMSCDLSSARPRACI